MFKNIKSYANVIAERDKTYNDDTLYQLTHQADISFLVSLTTIRAYIDTLMRISSDSRYCKDKIEKALNDECIHLANKALFIFYALLDILDDKEKANLHLTTLENRIDYINDFSSKLKNTTYERGFKTINLIGLGKNILKYQFEIDSTLPYDSGTLDALLGSLISIIENILPFIIGKNENFKEVINNKFKSIEIAMIENNTWSFLFPVSVDLSTLAYD